MLFVDCSPIVDEQFWNGQRIELLDRFSEESNDEEEQLQLNSIVNLLIDENGHNRRSECRIRSVFRPLRLVPDGKGPAKVQSIEFANYPVVSHSDRRRLSGLGVLCLVRETERMIRLLKQGGRGGGGGGGKTSSSSKDD